MSEASFVLSVNYEKVFRRIKDNINMNNWFKKEKEIFISLKNNEIDINSSPPSPTPNKKDE